MELELKGVVDAIMAFVRDHRAWAPLVIGVLAFGESLAFVSLVLPFWGLLIAVGALVGVTWNFEFWALLTAAAVGAALGDWLSYWLGYYYHRQIAAMWPLSKYPDLLPQGHRFFEKWGAWAIVLGRFSGPLRASVPIVAGTVRMQPAMFQIANWSSAFLWAAVLLVFGDGIGRSWGYLSRMLGWG
jgi:membrane protein DedA with SNARE-associated domain